MPETKRPLKVFLCHAHADRDSVRGLYTRLTQDGVDAWLDKAKLLPGQDWELEYRKAVREADVVVVCLSKQFNQAGFRQKEVRLALDTAMEKPEGEIFIIPVRLEECDNLESLKKWHWVDLFEDDGYEMLIRVLGVRANKIGVALHLKRSWLPEVTPFERERHPEEKKPDFPKGDKSKEPTSSAVDVGGNVSGSVVVAGSNNVINMGTRARGFLLSNKKDLETAKSHVSEERVLEAAIEKQVIVGKPASLFVWIRRQASKNIISVISSIDEKVLLDEDNVKTKGLEIEFPTEDGQILPVGITLRLVAHEFIPSEQQKKIIIPPEGDSKVCTFIVTPKKAGELLLSLEVLKDEVSIANRNLRTIAIDIEKKVDNTLVLLTIPIIVLVQTTTSISSGVTTVKGRELIEAERQASEKIEREGAERSMAERQARERFERESAERSMSKRETSEKIERERAERSMAERAESEKLKREKSYSQKRKSESPQSQQSHLPAPSPIVALLLSLLLFGGAGQIYIGQVAKGVAIIIASFILSIFGIGIIIWFVGCIDAYILADRKRKGEVIKEWQWFWS